MKYLFNNINNKKNKILLLASYYTGNPFIAPHTCSIGTTSKCNSRCIYCSTWSNAGIEQELSLTKFESLINSLTKLGVKEILFSGGEPFLNQNIVEMVDISTKMGFSTRIITNGTKLSEEIICKLISMGLKRIGISIDALNPEVYYKTRGISIDKCLQTLEILKKVKIKYPDFRVDLYTVINKFNIEELLNLQDFANEAHFNNSFQTLQMDEIIKERIESVWPSSSEIDRLEEIVQILIKRKNQGYAINNMENYLMNIPNFFRARTASLQRCFAGYMRLNIDEQLNVKTCWMMPPIGNISSEKIEDIWDRRSHNMKVNRLSIRKNQCPGCFFPCHIEGNISFGKRY